MNRTAHKLNDFLATVASYDYVEEPIPKTVCAQAAGLMVELAPKPKRRKGLDLPGRTKEQRREERRDRIARVRATVFAAWDDNCALCLLDSTAADVLKATELHHLLSGNGTRRAEERADTCLPLCLPHHRKLHAGDLATWEALADLISEPDLDISLAACNAVERRLAKMREARSTEGRNG